MDKLISDTFILSPKDKAIMLSGQYGGKKFAISMVDSIRDSLSESIFSSRRNKGDDIEKYDYFTQVKLELEKMCN